RKHLLARGRGHALSPPANHRGGGGRQTRPGLGRDPLRLCHAQAGRRRARVGGEAPCACLAREPDPCECPPTDIIAWCRANLAHYKVPRAVVFGVLPKTSTGKIQKFELRERAKEHLR